MEIIENSNLQDEITQSLNNMNQLIENNVISNNKINNDSQIDQQITTQIDIESQIIQQNNQNTSSPILKTQIDLLETINLLESQQMRDNPTATVTNESQSNPKELTLQQNLNNIKQFDIDASDTDLQLEQKYIQNKEPIQLPNNRTTHYHECQQFVNKAKMHKLTMHEMNKQDQQQQKPFMNDFIIQNQAKFKKQLADFKEKYQQSKIQYAEVVKNPSIETIQKIKQVGILTVGQARQLQRCVENEAQALANRIALLKQEEKRTKIKIYATAVKTMEIIEQKKQNKKKTDFKGQQSQMNAEKTNKLVGQIKAYKEADKDVIRRMLQKQRKSNFMQIKQQQRQCDELIAKHKQKTINQKMEIAQDIKLSEEKVIRSLQNKRQKQKVNVSQSNQAETEAVVSLALNKKEQIMQMEQLELDMIKSLQLTQNKQKFAFDDLEVALSQPYDQFDQKFKRKYESVKIKKEKGHSKTSNQSIQLAPLQDVFNVQYSLTSTNSKNDREMYLSSSAMVRAKELQKLHNYNYESLKNMKSVPATVKTNLQTIEAMFAKKKQKKKTKKKKKKFSQTDIVTQGLDKEVTEMKESELHQNYQEFGLAQKENIKQMEGNVEESENINK